MASGTCPFCQGTLSPTARFCIHCGKKLADAPQKPSKPTEAELQKKIAAAVAEGVCTYVHTGSNFAKQKWWRCFTCSDAKKIPENWGACQVCAVQCHRDLGHSIGFGGESNFYCDCGFTGQKSGSSGLCHALSVSSTGTSIHTSPSKPAPIPTPKPIPVSQPSQPSQPSRTSFSLSQPAQPTQTSISSRTSFSLSSGGGTVPLVSSKEDIKTIAKKLGIVDATPNTKPLKFEGTYLDLYRVESDDGIHMQWVVRNEQPFCPVKFSFDFTGSTGLNLHGPPKQDTIVAPGEAKKVGDIKTIDPEKGCNVSCSYSYALLAPDPVAVKAFQETKSKEKQDVVSLIKSLGFTSATPLDTMVSTVTKAGVKYYDPDFPPDPRSIRGNAKDEKGPIDEKTVVWKRPEEFLKSVNLFQGIDPNDINQGALGNCWFCCALSALAEFEHYIKRMFETKTINAAGIYRLKLYNETDVDPVVITVDDYFPCKAGPGGTGTPLFTHNKGDEIWVMLVEKAYAKMMSSYFQLRSGDPADAFSDLTGCPVDELELEDESTQKLVQNGSLWNLLKDCDKQKCVMAASKNGDDKFTELGHEPENKLGLVPGHAYSLIDVKEGLGVKLVRLRNPWGRFEWKGDWSDASPLWTEEAKKVFNPVLDDTDGTFYMSWSHFLANFDSIDICYAAPPSGGEWNTCRVKGHISTSFPYLPTSFYELKLSKKTHGYLSIFQADERVIGSSKPIDLGFAIFKGTDFKTVVAHNAVKTKNRSNIRFDLESGTYIVVPYTSGVGLARQLYFGGKREDQKEAKQFILALHSDLMDLKLTPVSSDAKSLNQARIALLKTVGRQQKWDQHCIYSVTGSGLCTFAVENGGDRDVDFTLDFEGSNNVLSAMGGLKVTKRVSPGEILLMQDLAPADPTKGYGFKYKSSRREV